MVHGGEYWSCSFFASLWGLVHKLEIRRTQPIFSQYEINKLVENFFFFYFFSEIVHKPRLNQSIRQYFKIAKMTWYIKNK